MLRALLLLFCLSLVGLLSACQNAFSSSQSVTLTVSAAADLAPAFEEIGKLFTEQTEINVVFNFGSTGQLAQQIEQGAPVDLFAAANVAFVDQLEQQGLILPDTKVVYARGRITLWTRADSQLHVERIANLAQPQVRKIAIANPDHAPYGIAARQALQSAGIWEAVQPKLVLAENIRQTLQYAETGDVDVAIVALSLSNQGRWTLIPQQLHQPIDQALAVIASTQHEQAARQFAAFVNGPAGRAILQKYGFTLPRTKSRTLFGNAVPRARIKPEQLQGYSRPVSARFIVHPSAFSVSEAVSR